MIAEPYFALAENRDRLRKVALSWLGTPFHAQGRVKGPSGGVSCVGLIYLMAVEIGLITADEIEFPPAPVGWPQHHEISLLGEFFRSPEIRQHVKRVDLEDGLMVGDLIPLKIKLAEHHLCQVIDEKHVIHCHRKKGVLISSIVNIESFMGGGIYRIIK